MNPRPIPSHSTLRLLVGWCALLFYVGAAAPVAPLLTAIVASFDQDHHAVFQCGSSGVQVVLQHDGGGKQPHRHGLIARSLTLLLAKQDGVPQPDHVLQFRSIDVSTRPAQEMALPSLRLVAQATLSSGGEWQPVTPLPVRGCFFALAPPDANGPLLNVRSTVFLI
jgi:hypothetical protein